MPSERKPPTISAESPSAKSLYSLLDHTPTTLGKASKAVSIHVAFRRLGLLGSRVPSRESSVKFFCSSCCSGTMKKGSRKRDERGRNVCESKIASAAFHMVEQSALLLRDVDPQLCLAWFFVQPHLLLPADGGIAQHCTVLTTLVSLVRLTASSPPPL